MPNNFTHLKQLLSQKEEFNSIFRLLDIYSTLLELGASPNYKDARGLTPLYLSVIKKTDSKICESLLHDHATLGTQDVQGWQEVHQVIALHPLSNIFRFSTLYYFAHIFALFKNTSTDWLSYVIL